MRLDGESIDEWAKREGHESPPFCINIINCERIYVYWKNGQLYIHQL